MQLYAAGSRFQVYLWEEDGQCPVLDFLRELAQEGQSGRENAQVLDRHLRQFGDHGPPRGEERCRFFNEENIFELKAHAGKGARIMGFYVPGRATYVLFTHGFDKPKNYRPEIERAQAIRAMLLAEKNSDEKSSAQKTSRRKGKK